MVIDSQTPLAQAGLSSRLLLILKKRLGTTYEATTIGQLFSSWRWSEITAAPVGPTSIDELTRLREQTGLDWKPEQKLRKSGSGGKREGSGRPKGRTKETVSLSLDSDLVEWMDITGGKGERSAIVNKALRWYKDQSKSLNSD